MTKEERDERDKKMIDEWLKKNEPSVKIKHGEKMPHLPQIGKIKQGG
jgi:hypothetical protein